ncbi:hypothetical protein Mycsm_01651 [Mycobacterium sp. JS623]|nr:hypothetical protein Mycsm_01651 [Mycobacterium sp. JS623]
MEANRASPRGHSVPASLLARPASPLACTCAGGLSWADYRILAVRSGAWPSLLVGA